MLQKSCRPRYAEIYTVFFIDAARGDQGATNRSKGRKQVSDKKRPNDNPGYNTPEKKKSKASSGAAKYGTTYDPAWTDEFHYIHKGTTAGHFWCSICRVERSCSHQGKTDVKRHIESEGHQRKMKAADSNQQKKMDTFCTPLNKDMSLIDIKVGI